MAKRSINLSSNAPTETALTIADMPAMKVIKKVTVPTLRQTTDGSIVAFTATGPMVESKKALKNAEGNTNKATLLPCIDLMTGNDAIYVVPAILKSTLEDDYTDDDGTPNYVGKSFAVQKLPKRDGKRYRDLNVVEIDGEDFAINRKAQLARLEANAEAAA